MTRQLTDAAKRQLLMLADALTLALALWLAVVFRHGQLDVDLTAYWWLFPTASLAGLAGFIYLDLYRAIVRYIGPSSMLPVLGGVSLAAVATALAAYLTGAASFPRSSVAIFWALALLLIGGGRFLVRTYFYGLFNDYLLREPVAIYGAGETGAQLAMALLNGGHHIPVAFLDDDPGLRSKTISGVRVYGADDLRQRLDGLGVKRVLLAMPSLSGARRGRVLNKLARLPVEVHTVPPLKDIVTGAASVAEVRAIDLGDLLGRETVPPDAALLSQAIAGKNILVTGAAGTIGAEICRKIIARRPRRLVLYDLSEYGLYRLEPEIGALQPEGTEVIPALGSLLHPGHLRQTLAAHGIDTVYHAAAYKHVPMVEQNVVEGARNNVLGSWAVAQAVADSGADELVMVSSDKAVRPASIMGASKRLAELVVQGFAQQAAASGSGKRFCAVRFGNVLRSSGSVVPLFERQIESGGPVTVTHPEATRYFMTSSEAAELVIQAGVMAAGGEIFVLDMGSPVSILELAEKMIHLHGKEVGEDPADARQVAIRFTGLRLGEKLHEELMHGGQLSGTHHPKILSAQEDGLPWERLLALRQALEAACSQGDGRQVKALMAEHLAGCRLAGEPAAPLPAAKVTPIKRPG